MATLPTNKFALPEPVYLALIRDPYNAGDSDITTTQLIDPPQLVTLRKRHQSNLIRDVSEGVWAMLGKAVHAYLEKQVPEHFISEERYFAKVNGWKVSGQVDLIGTDTLNDYKLTSAWTYLFGSRMKEWTEQANINHWLYHQATGKYVTRVQNILFLRDWVKSKYTEGGSYPPVQVVTVDLPLWPLEKSERFVEDRVKLHQEAREKEDSFLPLCSHEERWWNDKRKQFIRCAEYCDVSEKCSQWNGGKPLPF